MRFAGYQGKIKAWFDLIDILVHVPAYEAFGLVLGRAMMAGKQFIAAPARGIRDIVVGGSTGLYMPPGAHAALEGADASLVARPNLAGQLGRAGQAGALSRHSGARYIGEVAALYRELLAKHAPRSVFLSLEEAR